MIYKSETFLAFPVHFPEDECIVLPLPDLVVISYDAARARADGCATLKDEWRMHHSFLIVALRPIWSGAQWPSPVKPVANLQGQNRTRTPSSASHLL